MMVFVAMYTGMRVSEVLALRWEHIDFEAGAMLVQQGVVNGRIGKVKTEASNDYIPLDAGFAQILLGWKEDRSSGLVFPSHITGGCYPRKRHSAPNSETCRRKGRHLRDWLAHVQALVSLIFGRNGCSDWRPAKADAAQQRGNDHERVRQCELESQAAGQFKGCRNADHTEFTADGATKSSGLTFCGVLWGWMGCSYSRKLLI
jgi:integrase